MQLTNEFTIPLDVDDAWTILTDIHSIASCMPGATITESNGDDYKGTIKIKIGPINALFVGEASVKRNARSHTAIISVDGSDTKGQGFAKGTITATVTQSGDGSLVTFDTDVTVTGRMASFGRNVMSDVSDKLFKNFADCVERDLIDYG